MVQDATSVIDRATNMRTKLFISYSHEDLSWLKRLRQQLAVLDRNGLLDAFDDNKIFVGENWLQRLTGEMQQARVALLLVSASFLDSDFITKTEIPTLLHKQETEGLILYPLLVRDCPWQLVPWLARLQLRPTGVRPVAERRGAALDRCLADVARELASLVTPSTSHPTMPDVSTTQPTRAYVIYVFSNDDAKLQASRVALAENIERILRAGVDKHGVEVINALIINQHNAAWQYYLSPTEIDKHLDEAEALYSHLMNVAMTIKPSEGTSDVVFALGRMKDSMLHRIRTLRTKSE